MHNLFIKKDDEFEIVFWVAEDKDNGTLSCDITEEDLKGLLQDGREYDIQEYKAVFRKPSFGDTIDLYDRIFSVNPDSTVEFNPLMARYKKISLLLKSWTLKDSEDNDVAITEDNIANLHPMIASAIGIQVDIETAGLLAQM
jgi:hypothetical protein